MFLARTDVLKYVGFDGEKHLLEGVLSEETVQVFEAKLVDTPSSMVFMLKRGGEIEPTYGTVRKFGIESTGRVLSRLLSGRKIEQKSISSM